VCKNKFITIIAINEAVIGIEKLYNFRKIENIINTKSRKPIIHPSTNC
jgi:hypothetical protein